MKKYFIYALIDGKTCAFVELDKNVRQALSHILNDYVGHNIEIVKICHFTKKSIEKELKCYIGKHYYTEKAGGF